MNYLIRYSPEITIKSRPIRKSLAKQLRRNLSIQLRRLSQDIEIEKCWDHIEVSVPASDDHLRYQVEQVLARTQGICFFERVQVHSANTLEEILFHTLPVFQERLGGSTFAVRCRRTGSHDFDSMDIEKFVGSSLVSNTAALGVNLSQPDITVKLELRDDTLYVVEKKIPGLNGFPLGFQDGALSLLSGGFDSSVSTYLAMRRGLITHFCFFNLGGKAHEIAVKEVALHLWLRYGSTHPVKFITVPFEGVVSEILEKVDNSQMGVVLKRMMLRAASHVAQLLKLEAIVTGESIAQVSSQTLPNLAVIDKVSDVLVLRPLAMMNKQEIIDIAREIGTEEFSTVIPEYCGVISVKPTTRARMHKIEKQEGRFDFSILDKALANLVREGIDKLELNSGAFNSAIRIASMPGSDEVVLDIRHPDEEEQQPLVLPGHKVEKLPFYKLNSRFAELPRQAAYLLYCEKGIMSKLHASYLKDEGYDNVGVYSPNKVIQP
ncbi:tRNA 4-thiouridine(8) synthase ThiI [Gammaproteobacteria bacterium]|nr:tRNA 4-thiouridine(8) synthase ThiI [Gammaproteobacteria bacterium]